MYSIKCLRRARTAGQRILRVVCGSKMKGRQTSTNEYVSFCKGILQNWATMLCGEAGWAGRGGHTDGASVLWWLIGGCEHQKKFQKTSLLQKPLRRWNPPAQRR